MKRVVASNTSLAEIVASNIRAEMARRSVKQKDLAALLDCPQSLISGRLNGRNEWKISEIEIIADYLEVSVALLMGIQEYPVATMPAWAIKNPAIGHSNQHAGLARSTGFEPATV